MPVVRSTEPQRDTIGRFSAFQQGLGFRVRLGAVRTLADDWPLIPARSVMLACRGVVGRAKLVPAKAGIALRGAGKTQGVDFAHAVDRSDRLLPDSVAPRLGLHLAQIVARLAGNNPCFT